MAHKLELEPAAAERECVRVSDSEDLLLLHPTAVRHVHAVLVSLLPREVRGEDERALF